jgi:TetR/AcrR family transcriptional repressor of mexJK operon
MVKAEAALRDANAETPTGKRLLIVEAATRVFLDLGYGAASMDAIAAEAGVSKQTVYSHFGAKEALFEAIIEDKCDELLAPVFEAFRPGHDHAKALDEVAWQFLSVILAPPSTALFRVIVSESVRFPELANAFYRAGPQTAVDNLAGYLKELNRAGVIATNDPMASARQFFALLRGDLYMRRLLDLAPEPTAAKVAAVAHEAVTGFLAIHAPG